MLKRTIQGKIDASKKEWSPRITNKILAVQSMEISGCEMSLLKPV